MPAVTASPFTSSATLNSTITLPQGNRLILRCATGSVKVHVKVGKDATASVADYFLEGGDAVEIRNDDETTVNILAITGTPDVYWRVETLTPWN
jgi:redox-sensitive bicupin YhaK (pirin superfamily)